MITLYTRVLVRRFTTAFLTLVSMSCNTAHGFGKDMEKAGGKIQEDTQ